MRLTVNMWTVARCSCNVSFNWLITSSKWTAEPLDGTQRLITHRHLSELSQFAIGCVGLRVVIYLFFTFSFSFCVVDSDATTIIARIVVHCFHPIADCFADRLSGQRQRQTDKQTAYSEFRKCFRVTCDKIVRYIFARLRSRASRFIFNANRLFLSSIRFSDDIRSTVSGRAHYLRFVNLLHLNVAIVETANSLADWLAGWLCVCATSVQFRR